MKNRLIKAFWDCGDSDIIEFAILKARLNKREKQVIELILDECLTQEEVAELLCYSTRRIQDIWYKAVEKLLNIAWVKAYAQELLKESKDAKEEANS